MMAGLSAAIRGRPHYQIKKIATSLVLQGYAERQIVIMSARERARSGNADAAISCVLSVLCFTEAITGTLHSVYCCSVKGLVVSTARKQMSLVPPANANATTAVRQRANYIPRYCSSSESVIFTHSSLPLVSPTFSWFATVYNHCGLTSALRQTCR